MKQAVILAAGEGLRLQPFTLSKPKAMLSIAGKPIIQYVIESLAVHGIRNIIIVVGYQKEQIFDYFGDGKRLEVELKYVTQQQRLGTADALNQARSEIQGDFLVLAGNKLITSETIVNFVNVTPPAILVKKVDNPSRYGVIALRDDKFIAIVEKPERAESNLINTGIYSFSDEIFSRIQSELNIPDVINNILKNGEPINLVETDKAWLDVVYPWDILSLNSIILGSIAASQNGVIEAGVYLKGHVSIGRDTIIRSNSYIVGPVVIGKGCEIGPNVCIFPSTSIGDNTIISPFSEIENSVIDNDIRIASNSVIQDSVIASGCVIGTHFSAASDETEVKVDTEHHVIRIGSMLGRGCRIGSNVTAQAGTIIGNYCQVKSPRSLTGVIPDRSLVL
ncbi:MAG TPA: bifunctional sugar-1-phosphate nucleotidylyltransferase/acetyltransferase [Dehalococcoidales bacterium]